MNRHPNAMLEATRTRILDVGERLVQTRGFNGFSYADIAAEVGITKASLHYHFATKAELGRMLVGALEGEMLVARAYGDPMRFETAARLLLAQLGAGTGTAPAVSRRARKPTRRAPTRERTTRRRG